MVKTKSKITVFTIALALMSVLAIVVIEYINKEHQTNLENELNNNAQKQLATVRYQLESALISDIYLTSTLAELVPVYLNGRNKILSQVSKGVLNKSHSITSIGFAKGDIINYVYPFEGNSKALGLNYKDVPAQWAQVKLARDVQQPIVAGPVELIQGGQALIVRVPVFYDAPYNTSYWGVISGVINYDKLFNSIDSIQNLHEYTLTIIGYYENKENANVIYGHLEKNVKGIAMETVNLPYGTWELSLSSNYHLSFIEKNCVRLIGYPTLLLFILFFVFIFRLYIIHEYQSYHDTLTKAPNRRYFFKKLDKIFADAKAEKIKGTFAIINIDIDKFKLINDTYGHAAGDKVLTIIFERIKVCIRKNDVVARMGGDEYLILMHAKNDNIDFKAKATEIVNRITENPIVFNQTQIPINISFGYSVFNKDLKDVDEMMAHADDFMYLKKEKNRL